MSNTTPVEDAKLPSEPAAEKISELSLIRILNRYISVWIWSIQTGILVSLTFASIRAIDFGNYRVVGFGLIVFIFPLFVLLYRAWSSLLRYLAEFIIPVLMYQAQEQTLRDNAEVIDELIRSFRTIIHSLLAYALLIFAEQVLEAFFRSFL
ncbi:MAG: hypothetical protein Tsb0019_26760 [Roseibium sp.]